MANYFPSYFRAPARRPAAPRVRAANPANWDAFVIAQPERAAWIERKAPTFEFAASMKVAVMRFADLTAGQAAAVDKCIARDAERAAAPAAPVADTVIDQTAIRAVLATRKKVTIAGFSFSIAGPGSRNHQAIYVKQAGVYVGKVLLGGTQFMPSREFDMGQMGALRAIFAEPGEAVRRDAADRAARLLANPELTIPCGCCGIMLTDPVSIARGIGPICAGKWGF
jgi:hypothetical protein